MKDEIPKKPTENESVEHNGIRINATRINSALQLLRHIQNNSDDDLMLVCIPNHGQSRPSVSVQVSGTSSSFTARFNINPDGEATPNAANRNNPANNDNKNNTSDKDNNSNTKAAENKDDKKTEPAEEVKVKTDGGECSKTNEGNPEDKDTGKRPIESDEEPKKRFKAEENIPDR